MAFGFDGPFKGIGEAASEQPEPEAIPGEQAVLAG
jgi:hypothetical protein